MSDLPGSLPAPAPELAAARTALAGAGFTEAEIDRVQAGLPRHDPAVATADAALFSGLAPHEVAMAQSLIAGGVSRERVAAALGHDPAASDAAGDAVAPEHDLSAYTNQMPDYQSVGATNVSGAELREIHEANAQFAQAIGLAPALFPALAERVCSSSAEIAAVPQEMRAAFKAERVGLLNRLFSQVPGGLREVVRVADLALSQAQKSDLFGAVAGKDASDLGAALDPALLHLLYNQGKMIEARQKRGK